MKDPPLSELRYFHLLTHAQAYRISLQRCHNLAVSKWILGRRPKEGHSLANREQPGREKKGAVTERNERMPSWKDSTAGLSDTRKQLQLSWVLCCQPPIHQETTATGEQLASPFSQQLNTDFAQTRKPQNAAQTLAFTNVQIYCLERPSCLSLPLALKAVWKGQEIFTETDENQGGRGLLRVPTQRDGKAIKPNKIKTYRFNCYITVIKQNAASLRMFPTR